MRALLYLPGGLSSYYAIVTLRPEQLGLSDRGLAHLLDLVGDVAVGVLNRLSFILALTLIFHRELLTRRLFVEERAFQRQLG